MSRKLALQLVVVGTICAIGLPWTRPTSTIGASSISLQAQQQLGDPSTLVGSGSVNAGSGSSEAETAIFRDPMTMAESEAFNAAIRARQNERRAGRPPALVQVPEGTFTRPAVDVPATQAAEQPGNRDTVPAAPNDMVFFKNHAMTSTEVPSWSRSSISEPTSINLGAVVFSTGNSWAAKSTDSGSSFTYVNPYTLFPSINGGFCCDQVTAYAPVQDMALWGLQYFDDGVTNSFRIARAIGASGVASDNWSYWTFNPQDFGWGQGVWLDFPSITVGSTYLYATTNVFYISGGHAGAVVFRIPLEELAAGGAVSYDYFSGGLSTLRLAEGAGTTMYIAGFTTSATMRIHRWSDGGNTIFWDEVGLNVYYRMNRDGVATSPDGTNWAAFADSRPLGAYVAKGVIGVMWTARQGDIVGPFRPKPYVVHARFSEATRALISQADIWHPDYAWMYPAVSPNAAGDLAGTMQVGGAASGTAAYPSTQVWITDDVTGASDRVGALYSLSVGNDGPDNNRWGDYFSVRPHKVMANTWVAASFALIDGGLGANAVPRYTWFGRERDNFNVKAAITYPLPGNTLGQSPVTFGWSTGWSKVNRDLEYYLSVGTTGPGSSNIYAGNEGQSLSRTVHKIPLNGSTVYVRMWTYFFETGWAWTDYTYSTADLGFRKATITSPAPGSTLAGASATFSWNTGHGALSYHLHVGLSPGSSNIYSGSQGLALTKTVSGLPGNGRPVYLRLWTELSWGWEYADYTYTAASLGPVKAVMTSPSPGATLRGSAAFFGWDPGTGALEYWLSVGTTGVGSSNIWDVSNGFLTSRDVNGIPVSGAQLYVRLWTRFVSGWQFNDYIFTGYTAAGMTSPAPSSTLTGSVVKFDWNAAANALEYNLDVGTTGVGSFDIISNESQGLALTKTVTGLPLTGVPLYVRLWTRLEFESVYRDYVYTLAPVRARLTSPAAGAVLGGSSATFNWSPGGSSTQYWLYVGSTYGGYDIWNQNQGTDLARLVTGIPTDGRRIHVRLWSYVGAWYYSDYSFTASGTTRARLVSPAEGTNLPGPSVTFSWEAGSGATSYWLYVGTSRGADNIWNQNQGAGLTRLVTGLPLNQMPIYVRLWSLISGVWTYNDYDFLSSDGGSFRARMSSPSNGATLVGSSTTFTWVAGSGASQYYLHVGTTGVGSSNILSQSQALALSRTLTGLPTNGATVYVRLWTLRGGIWSYNDYTFKAAP